MDSAVRKPWFKVGVLVAVIALLGLAGVYFWHRPPAFLRYDLRLATGPVGSDGQKLLAAFNRELASDYPLVHIVPVQTDDLSANGRALIDGRADLAVVRSDDPAAGQGQTLFILRRIGVAVILPPDSKIEHVGELAGKKLAITKAAHFDPALLKTLSQFYALNEADFVEVLPTQLGQILKSRKAVAAIVFGPMGAGPIPDAFASIRKAFKEPPSFLDIAESEAIAARFPAYESFEIKQGTFGGAPPEPDDAINTFAVTVRLVSRASLPDRVAGEITRMLLATKARLAATVPDVGQMEAPDTEKTSLLPVHPGTLAYLNGDQESLLDETLNYYWLLGMVAAVLAPAAGWVGTRIGLRRRDEARTRLLRVVELVRLSKSGTTEELASADAELDDLLEWLFGQLASGEIERDQFQCIERMIAQLRGSIEKRRADLAAAALKPAAVARG
jgi:TRAP-type uncharacterized transport system substrate-binding protein